MNVTLPDLDRGNAPCPRCGADATWIYTDTEKNWVEISCPDCGKVDMPANEFDRAETEIIAPEDRA